MPHHIHHVHLFAAEIDKSLRFYREFFGGEIVADIPVAGARNVFMKIGSGRLNFYDQAPKNLERGGIHHIGIQTDDVDGDFQRMESSGLAFRKPPVDLGYMKYLMVPAPDGVLIELFEINRSVIPAEYHDYFVP